MVLVQPSLFDDYRRRVVVPLARRTTLPAHTGTAGSRVHPVFEVDGIAAVLHPLDMVSVALDQLGAHGASLAEFG